MTAIVTQGRQDDDQWVKSYKICYSQKLDGYCEPIDQVPLILKNVYLTIDQEHFRMFA